jgi:hypothetical protein
MKTIKVKDLMAIAGKGGIFRYLAQARNGVVVESLKDKKRTVAPPSARVSALEDISIFTKNEDMPLSDVLFRIHEKEAGGPSIDSKSGNEDLKKYFEEIIPEYDQDKVYVSDIKKLISWYNQLQSLGLLEIIDKEEDKEEDQEEKKAPKKKSAAKVKDSASKGSPQKKTKEA